MPLQVTLMAPHLGQQSCEVNVPMKFGAYHGYDGVPVHEWTAEQVIEWLATTEGGRFSYVEVRPPNRTAACPPTRANCGV
jgi:hypothetical protein